jgi:hypothetical protein
MIKIKEVKRVFYAENNGKVFRMYESENGKYDAVVDDSEKNAELIKNAENADIFIEIKCKYNVSYKEAFRFFVENGLNL